MSDSAGHVSHTGAPSGMQAPRPAPSRKLRALMLTRYSRGAASARYRMFQYVPLLDELGITCHVRALLPDDYLTFRFGRKSIRGSLNIARGYAKRFGQLQKLRNTDVLYVQLEFFPFLPYGIESRLVPASTPYVLDYDDAWFHGYDLNRNALVRAVFATKMGRLMRGAASIVVGSEYLRRYVSRFNPRVHFLPTAVDIERYPVVPPLRPSDSPFTICWIGSPTTAPFLRLIEGALRAFCASHEVRLVIIGAGAFRLDVSSAVYLPWSEESEVAMLSQCDVGIMPLPDTPFTRGKCAFKLIQYMACWKAIVASPVGENVRVVGSGDQGFLASTERDWLLAFERLYADRALGSRMGMLGRSLVEKAYNSRRLAPRLGAVLAGAARTPAS